jgi:hypothetical protein
MKAVFAFLAVLAADSGPDAGSPPPASRARITVRAIACTTGGEATDPKLSPIARNLAEFAKDFRWRAFRLLTEQTFELAWESAAQMELPGSRSVQVSPRQLSPDGRIQVHLELLGEHPAHARKLHTDYSIERGGTIFVGGLRLDPAKPDAGVLLVAITQEAE